MELLVTIFLWRVLFQSQSTIQGYDWNQMILYALIVALLNATLSMGTEMNLSAKILDGSIASDLVKPVDIQHMSFFQVLGESAVEGGVSLVVISVMAVLLTNLSGYLNPWRLLLFASSLILAFLLKFSLVYLGGLLSQTIGLLFMGVLFLNVPAIAGWNVYEVALLYGYMFVAEGCADPVFPGNQRTVKTGQER